MVIGYLLRKAPSTFAVACRILTEIKYRLPYFTPKTMLDFGAGIGSGAIAFNDLFQNNEHLVCCEPQHYMRKIGKHLTQDIKNVIWIDNLQRLLVLPKSSDFDIVYLGHVLQELPNSNSRQLVIDQLWNLVRKNGILIIVDNGSPKGFRFMNDCRSYILNSKKADHPYIVAPCMHHQTCPLQNKGNSWCHFWQDSGRFPKDVFSKLPNETMAVPEKFCFLAIRKGEVDFTEETAKTAAEKSFFWNRIVFRPIRKGGHTIIDLCTPEGSFERRIVSKSHGVECGYKEVKKLEWGDLWKYKLRIPNRFRKETMKGKRLW